MADFNLPHLRLAPPYGVMPFEFAVIFGMKKLESLGYRVALLATCVILCLAVLIQYWSVTDTQADRETHDDGMYRASIASRGKNDGRAFVYNDPV